MVKDRRLTLNRLAKALADVEGDPGPYDEPIASLFVVLDGAADGANEVFRKYGISSAPAGKGQLSALLDAPEVAREQPILPDGLTDRDLQVLKLLVDGLSNKEIGYQLEIPEPTVKRSVQRIFARCGVRTRAQVVRAVMENRFGGDVLLGEEAS